MDCQLVVVDLDNTFLNNRKEISPASYAILDTLKQRNIAFGIASGRAVESVLRSMEAWGITSYVDFVIGSNGNSVYDVHQQKKKRFYTIDGTICLKIMEAFQDIEGVFFVLNGPERMIPYSNEWTQANAAYYSETDHVVDLPAYLQSQEIEKFVFHCHPKDMEKVKKRYQSVQDPSLVGYPSAPELFDIMHAGVDKGNALKWILRQYHIPWQAVLAFGDAENDQPLLKEAGHGVCMKNGTQSTKDMADAITSYTNDEDGVARYITSYIKTI